MASAVLLACAIAFSEGALSGRRLGLAVQPPQRADVSMRSGRKSSRSKPVKQTRGGGEGFGSSTPPTTSSGQRTPAGVSDEPARERVTPSHDALLSSQLALNAAEHQRECEAGLAAWPSIATAAGATPVGTLPRSVRSDSLLSPNNEPFRTRDLVHITTAPVLAPDACAAIVAEAEATGNAHGWASRYTLQDSSRELHAAELPKSAALIAAALPGIAATAAAVLVPSLGPDGSHLRVYNALVVRCVLAHCPNLPPLPRPRAFAGTRWQPFEGVQCADGSVCCLCLTSTPFLVLRLLSPSRPLLAFPGTDLILECTLLSLFVEQAAATFAS
jgi:hypothetical protein